MRGYFFINTINGIRVLHPIFPNKEGVDISKKRDKPIFILDGFGGQNITIDFENNKIIAILSIHRDHNWMKLVHSKFKE